MLIGFLTTQLAIKSKSQVRADLVANLCPSTELIERISKL